MVTPTRFSSRACSLVLAVMLVAVNVGAPLLDIGRGAARVEIAALHHGGGGAIEHHHLLCIQHSASGSLAAIAVPPSAELTAGTLTPSPDDPGFSDQASLPNHPPRAPPFA
ncbi:MAG: hypothetical protein P8177_09295 [Gemmatimonadota bacterium]|jgi:hypothetical protein